MLQWRKEYCVMNKKPVKNYRLSVLIEKDKDGYVATCPELQGCYSQGDTYEEVIQNIRDAIALHIEDRVEAKEEITQSEFVSLTYLEVAV